MYIELFGFDVNVPAQICGLIGLVIILVSYQQKKLTFLWVQLIGYVFCLAESALCFGWTNVVITFTAMMRNVLMLLFLVKRGKELPLAFTLLLLAAMWGGCVPFFVTAFRWYDLLPPTLITLSTLCAISSNYYVLKAGALTQEYCFIAYQASIGAYIGVVRQVVLGTGVLISIIRMAVCGKKSASKATSAPDENKNTL